MRLCHHPVATIAIGLCLLSPPARAQDDTDWAFVLSNVIHILYHEVGHALVDQFALPVLGQEEDAVDAFATLEVLDAHDDAQDILLDAAEAMFLLHDLIDDEDAFAYYGAHDLDIQRAYRIVCHAYGTDPTAYDSAADWADLPESRREECEMDADLAWESWDSLLETTYREDRAPMTEIRVALDPSGADPDYLAALDESRIIEDFQTYLGKTFAWPAPLEIRFETCGEANAFYDPEAIAVIFCHEFADDLVALDALREVSK
ncbi:MAG: DUF4344 domain-containing metallopeptidase [Pseudomonadota bacterium]